MPRLALLIPDRGSGVAGDGTDPGAKGKRTAAPPPWSEPPAMLFFEIHGDVRRYEGLLSTRLFKRCKFRGGADATTDECVSQLPVLIDHARAVHLDRDTWHVQDLLTIEQALMSWPVRVRAMLDEARPEEVPWSKAPGDLRCPYCGARLELPPGWQSERDVRSTDVVCRRCRDAHGQYLRWPASTWIGELQDDPDEVTLAEAAAELDVPEPTLRTWLRRGHLDTVGRRGGVRTVRRSDVMAVVAERGVSA